MSNTNTDITNSNENQIQDESESSEVILENDQQDTSQMETDNASHESNENNQVNQEDQISSDLTEGEDTLQERAAAESNSEDTEDNQVSNDVSGIIEEDVQEEQREDLESSDVKKSSKSDNANNLNWYIVQTLSNYEKRVETRVQQIIDEEKYKGKLFRVLVPTQQTVELKNNKRLEKVTKIFPGYVFIQMDIEDELAYELRQIPGIAKFIGIGNKPTPVVEAEILKVLRKVGDTSKEIDVDFEVGEVIKVVDGPFRGYTGTISEINSLKGNIKSKISIFGRETPVELDFEQVEKTV
ncbi:MAG: transcription termination/antitermination factor NusG [Actinobacteria bacterium]|mgnify:CR=1 FL=1|nr:transcription termination/antitermination factor NusG [Actinomycetota bacterium]